MPSTKYIGMDVHKESISLALRNAAGKIVMECVIETKASMILQFMDGLRGDLQITFEEGTSAVLASRHKAALITAVSMGSCNERRNRAPSAD